MATENSQPPSRRKRIDLRLQAESGTPEGAVYHFLIQNRNWSVKQGKAMVGQAVQDYWLAYARQTTNPGLAKTTAMACIERMELQAAKLRYDFGLEAPAQAPVAAQPPELVTLLAQLISSVNGIPEALKMLASTGGVNVSSVPSEAPEAGSEPVKGFRYTEEVFAAVMEEIGSLEEDLSADWTED